MLDQSRSVIEELRKRLEGYQKRVEAIRDPAKIGEFYKAQEIAKSIEEDLSHPAVRRYISPADTQEVLRQATQLQSLEHSMKPYQVQKAVNDLRIQIRALLESLPGGLPGKPNTGPNYPWDDEETEKPEEKKDEEKKEKKDDDSQGESSR